MELFTMGENNGYTQGDVVEVARAFQDGGAASTVATMLLLMRLIFDNKNKTILAKPAIGATMMSFNSYLQKDKTR